MPTKPEILEYRFTCPLPNGVHARPANCLEQVVSGFASCVSVENLSNRKIANAKSVLSLVGADIKQGDTCLLKIEGEDCDTAYDQIVNFIEKEFPACDDILPEAAGIEDVYIPPVLASAGVRVFKGKSVVGGFGRGRIVFVEALRLPENFCSDQTVCPETELRSIDKAVAQLRSDITIKLGSGRMTQMESDVLKAHLSIASDVELLEKIHALITGQGMNAGQSIVESFNYFSGILKCAQSELIRERILDLQDVCSQLLKKIYGTVICEPVQLEGPSICIADNLTPSMFMAMDKRFISGMILLQGGNTSHTVILARSFGIPTLAGLKEAESLLQDDREMIVDANYGILIPEINENVERFYASERRKYDAELQRIQSFKDQPALTRDGVSLEVMANVATADEVEVAMANGAEGIGLFRTEMLYMGRDSAPTEEEQFIEYKRAAEYAKGNPVIIRTFDIGGDKEVEYLNLQSEENPFLGYRGARLYKEYEWMLCDQLRAILRASAFGNLKIMIPMVSCVGQVHSFRSVLSKVKAQLDKEGISYDTGIQLGMMVEVPSVAFFIAQLAGQVDFLSIGTNDLTQYLLAVDRGNDRVSSLYQSRHPGLLSLIKKIVEDAHRHELWVGICGEMAGQIEVLPLLLGAGVDEVSVSIPFISKIKSACSEYHSGDCRKVLDRAITVDTADQVEDLLKSSDLIAMEKSAIDVSLINLEADCINKEEVIKHACDVLFLDRRVRDSIELEKDFWRREAVYSTGLGHGFAIPHCKTKHIQSNSICVLRLKQPIEWGSVDSEPIRLVIAMTIQDGDEAGDTHMRIFSKLARNIMHEDFREQLISFEKPEDVVSYLHEKLGLDTSQER